MKLFTYSLLMISWLLAMVAAIWFLFAFIYALRHNTPVEQLVLSGAWAAASLALVEIIRRVGRWIIKTDEIAEQVQTESV